MTVSANPAPSAPPPVSAGLFREKALAKLSSPEHLDQLVRIVPPLGWLSLLAILVIISGALLWGFIGSVPTTVSGQGILLRGGKISSINSLGSGQLATLSVKIGDYDQQWTRGRNDFPTGADFPDCESAAHRRKSK